MRAVVVVHRMRRFAASFFGCFTDAHAESRAQIVRCLRICLLLSIGAISNGQAAARERTLLDAGWRFHLGEVNGYVLTSPGIPVTQWVWIADATAPNDAGVMAAPGLNTSGWSNITVGTDVFNGSQGAAWYREDISNFDQRIDDFHPIDRIDFRAPTRSFQIERAIEAEANRFGVHRRSVMEDGALAERQRQRLAVVRPFPFRRQHGRNIALLIDVDDLVAQRLQHVATDEAPVERRIERIGIVLQADLEFALRERRGRCCDDRERCGSSEQKRPPIDQIL